MEQLPLLVDALNTIYTDPNPVNKRRADEWICAFQRSVAAWEITDHILSHATEFPDFAVFFAAKTLRTKIQYAFEELKPENWIPLRDSVFKHLQHFQTGSKVVRTQLCLALAALAIRVEAWTNVVQSMVQTFPHDQVGGMNLLQILTVLPEECFDHGIMVNSARRRLLMDELEQTASVILELLSSLLQVASQPRNVDMQEQVFRCLQSWIRNCRIPSETITANPIVQSLATAIQDPEIFDSSVDVLVEIFRVYDNTDRDVAIAHLLVPQVMSLRTLFTKAASEEDMDTCRGLCRLFTEMSESYINLIVSEEEMNQEQILETLLLCMSLPDTEIADITLNFWFRFTEDLQCLKPESARRSLIRKYSTCLLHLATLCVQVLQFPDDFQDRVEDKQQDFKAFREELGNILRDCCRLVGTAQVLQQSVSGLVAVLDGDLNDPNGWKKIEAYLYATRSIAREVSSSEHEYLPRLFSLLPHVPQHPAVLYTRNLVINRYSRWIGQHKANVIPVFELLQSNLPLQNAQWRVDSTAAMSIRSLCIDNPVELRALALAMYGGLRVAAPNVSTADEIVLLEGICAVVSKVPLGEVVSVMTNLISPIVSSLNQAISQPNERRAEGVSAVSGDIGRLMCFFEHIRLDLPSDQPHPLTSLASELWPLLTQIAMAYGSYDEINEQLCRCFKRIIRSTQRQFGPLLPQLVELLLDRFQHSRCGSYLYCASVCVADFGQIPEAQTILIRLVMDLSSSVLTILTDLTQFTEHPEIVEEYFYLMDRALKYLPPLSSSSYSQMHRSVLKCAALGIHLQLSRPNQSVVSFIDKNIRLAQAGASSSVFLPIVSEEMPYLLHKLIQAVADPAVRLPYSYIDDSESGSLASILVALLRLNSPLVQQIAQQILTPGGPYKGAAEFLDFLQTSLSQVDFHSAGMAMRKFARENEARRQ